MSNVVLTYWDNGDLREEHHTSVQGAVDAALSYLGQSGKFPQSITICGTQAWSMKCTADVPDELRHLPQVFK